MLLFESVEALFHLECWRTIIAYSRLENLISIKNCKVCLLTHLLFACMAQVNLVASASNESAQKKIFPTIVNTKKAKYFPEKKFIGSTGKKIIYQTWISRELFMPTWTVKHTMLHFSAFRFSFANRLKW